MQFSWRHIGSATTDGDWAAHLATGDAGDQNQIDIILKSQVTFKDVTFYWTHDATHRYLNFIEENGANDGGVYVDNLSVKKEL